MALVAGCWWAHCVTEARAEAFSVLDFYRDEIARLVESPGSSSSVAAGLVNPAAWRIQDHGGLYLAIDDRARDGDLQDFRGVISLRNLGFGVRRLARGNADWYDYTVGLGFGTKHSATALSYSWVKGADDVFGDSQRVTAGWIYRLPWLSVGTTDIYDFAVERHVTQADLGLRPFGPRWTLFADVLAHEKNYDYRDLQWGYGVQAQVYPGVTVALRGTDDGAFGFRLDLGLSKLRPGMRYRMDNDAKRIATTASLEVADGSDLLRALGIGPRQRQADFRGRLSYRSHRWFDDRPRFLSLLQQIDEWASDPRVSRVVVNLSGFQASAANLWELRSQLAGLREQGKTVVIYFDRLGLPGYMLASVADELWMDPLGQLDLRGINFGRTYYKNALSKLGLGFEEWRFFKYKSAVESFSRTSFSDADREQWSELLHEFYDTMVEDIVLARGISREDFEGLVDAKGMILPSEAEELGLIDTVGDIHELNRSAVDAVARPGSDHHVAALGRLFGDETWAVEAWGEVPRIALLYAIGPTEMDSGIEGRRLSKLIRKMREDPRVKAVVLRADSPGGDPLPSDLVARELRETAAVKPVIVSQGQVAGSGGYWISMYGQQILASPLTVTGSIGVISGHLYDDGIGEKVGMDYDHVQIGRSADLESGPTVPLLGFQVPHRPSTEAERARVEEVIRDLYDDFVAKVAEGRSMSVEEVEAVAQGRIYGGRAGKDHGLVDEIGGLWQALLRAKEAAGLAPWERVQLVTGPSLSPLPSSLLQPKIFGSRIDLLGSADSRVIAVDGTPAPIAADAMVSLGFSPDFLSKLSVLERIYLQQMGSRPGQPMTLMPPMGLGSLLVDLD